MLNRIKALLTGGAAPDQGDHAAEVRLAAAALLVEAAQMDGQMSARERDRILDLLRSRFDLSAEEAEDLCQEAAARSADTHHLLPFTRVIKDRFEQAERVEMLEMLWEVAYADGHLHDYEANLVRRIGGLIYVSDQESGGARKRAMARLGVQDG